ncbi:MAG TPA: 1-deoxy-D-xylulose-5-phosphate reductoisomerase, partial [Gemmatimonadaceae bacterium]|nr:1-deoxy-D-xylulose-5-phosphate reductoisomerase [Gemmatimonadaceae bacterium]
DGSVLAQLGVPNMELPVLYALTHPERVADTGVPPFDPVELSPMTFEHVRVNDFPALALGVAAGRTGGAAPAVFNASNEEAVSLFLEGRIGFADIPRAIESALEALGSENGDSRDAIIAADEAARRHVRDRFRC